VRLLALLVVGVVVVGGAGSARAQGFFSPGPLSKAHAELEGMASCAKCHGEGAQHDNSRCIECHKEIGTRQAAREGYHGRLGAQLCAECHREHRGVGAEIISWQPSQKLFNHSLTTWPLVGSHKKTDCKKCHEPRLVVDDDAKKLMAKREPSFLGLPQRCANCHFDEHRSDEHGGRPGAACDKCHAPDEFKQAKGFDHNNKTLASFALTGLHKKVKCAECHTSQTDDRLGEFPAPKSASYMQFNDIAHASCVDCHDDPHHGNFGRNCTQCHSTAGWRNILQTADDFGFHDKTKFPLRGEHTSVACKTCHGPFPGQRAVFKGLKHERCADCHNDAHVGQIALDEGAVRCERCHVVTGFAPVTYGKEQHAQTAFPLEGSHGAVSCVACHTQDDKLARRVPSAVRAKVERMKRKVMVSEARIDLPIKRLVDGVADSPVRCESCHDDVHNKQFDARIAKGGCNSCHTTTSFADEIFKHDDSRFPLTGKHKTVQCAKCHGEETRGGTKRKPGTSFVRYRPIELACTTCHSDEHVGQLAKDGVTDCARCHSTEGFDKSKFQHDDPKQTRFVLEGKHKDVKCDKCHASTRVAGIDVDADDVTVRYKPLSLQCATCHEDEHEGRFDRFAPPEEAP
jgi:hypothetical protein